MLWVGAGLAIVAAVLLAFVPRLPSATSSQGSGLANGSVRITGGTNRRLQIFAMTQIAASFVLLAGASMLLKTLMDMQNARTPLDTPRILAVDLPVDSYDKTQEQINHFYEDVVRKSGAASGRGCLLRGQFRALAGYDVRSPAAVLRGREPEAARGGRPALAGYVRLLRDFSLRWVCRFWRDATSTIWTARIRNR